MTTDKGLLQEARRIRDRRIGQNTQSKNQGHTKNRSSGFQKHTKQNLSKWHEKAKEVLGLQIKR